MFATLALIITAAPQTLEAPAAIEAAPWTTLRRGVQLRFGSSPLAAQTNVPAVLQLSVDTYDLFTTRRMTNRWKCLPPESSELRIERHPEVLELRVGVSDTVTMLPTPLQVDPKTTRLRWALTLIETGEHFEGSVLLLTPLTLSPLELRMLNDLRSLAPAAVMRNAAGLRFVRVERDVCGDTSLQLVDVSPSTGEVLTRSGEWELVRDGPWLYSRRSYDRDFLAVSPRNLVFLGFPYSLVVAGVEGDVVRFTEGDFLGCFGASCGTPINLRERAFELYPDGRIFPHESAR